MYAGPVNISLFFDKVNIYPPQKQKYYRDKFIITTFVKIWLRFIF